MAVLGIEQKSFAFPSEAYPTGMRAITRDGNSGGDAASFSQSSLEKSKYNTAANDKISGAVVTAQLKQNGGNGLDGTYNVEFNNTSGAIKFDGANLNLSGFADARKDDLAVKKPTTAFRLPT